MFQDRLQELEIILSRLEATNARLEATNASLRQDIDLSCTGRIVLNEPHVYTKHHACFFRVPVFTGVCDYHPNCKPLAAGDHIDHTASSRLRASHSILAHSAHLLASSTPVMMSAEEDHYAVSLPIDR